MDLRALIQIAKSRWRPIVLLTVLGLAAAAVSVNRTTAVYRASTQVFVSTQGDYGSSELLSGSTFTQDRVQSYVNIVTSPLVLQPVINELHLDTSAGALAKHVSASTPAGTVVINLSVEEDTPAEAAVIANSLGQKFALAVGKLEQPVVGGVAPLRVTVTQPALVPSSPISPDASVDLILGLFIGVVLGIGVAVLMETLDTKLRDEDGIRQLTDARLIGSIATDAAAPSRPLALDGESHGARAEAFRQLRTNFHFVASASTRSKSVLITSSVAGEGKTLTAVNLGVALAAAGSSAVLVDADLRYPRLASYMGVKGRSGLSDVLVGTAKIDDVLQPWAGGDGVTVLPSGAPPNNPSELLASAVMQHTVNQLAERFDYVLIDSPPLLLFSDATVLASYTGGTLLVVGIEKVRSHQLQRSLEALAAVNASVAGVVSNFLPAARAMAASRPGPKPRSAKYPASRNGARRPEPTPLHSEIGVDATRSSSARHLS